MSPTAPKRMGGYFPDEFWIGGKMHTFLWESRSAYAIYKHFKISFP